MTRHEPYNLYVTGSGFGLLDGQQATALTRIHSGCSVYSVYADKSRSADNWFSEDMEATRRTRVNSSRPAEPTVSSGDPDKSRPRFWRNPANVSAFVISRGRLFAIDITMSNMVE